MRFRVPFTYRAEFIRRGRRKSEMVALASVADIQIEEAQAPSEPVMALACEPPFKRWFGGWHPFGPIDGRPVRLWQVDEAYFVEHASAHDFPAKPKEKWDDPFYASLDWVPSILAEDWVTTTYEELQAQVIIRSWKDDSSERLAAIERRAAAMRVIGGRVCVHVNQPVIVVESGLGSVRIRFAEASQDLGDGMERRPDDWSGRRFSVDRMSDAQAYAEMLASATGARRVSQASLKILKSVTPALAAEGEHLHQSARLLLAALELDETPEKHGYVEAWKELAEALDHCPYLHTTPRLAVALEFVLSELSRHLDFDASSWHCNDELLSDGEFRTLGDLEFHEGLPYHAGKALDDLERWKSRVIQAHDWSDKALEIAATRGSEPYQLLSGQALLEAASRLRLPASVLRSEHEAGNLLFMDHGIAGYQVAVLGPEWEVVRLIGPMGAKQRLVPSNALTRLLHANRQRRDDLESLGQSW
jgi:hypothetical protein